MNEKISKKCGCTGIRRCFRCAGGPIDEESVEELFSKVYIYCWRCRTKAIHSDQFDMHESLHLNGRPLIDDDSDSNFLNIDGIFLQENVIDSDEEQKLIEQIDSFDWVESQSGRRKQDFGPKINFKKRLIKFNNFVGLPKLDFDILKIIKNNRLREDIDSKKFESIGLQTSELCDRSILNNFKAVEICHLEYCPLRGSSIDPHFDDFWIWGERLVTINLQSTAIITLNLPDSYDHCIRIKCPNRSLLVLYGK
ncbi:hypothetical protein NH340_JMT07042 [Sarcoptes scabiei]|nr:hypothetical protein NH340_JMT07042 [Sarcoptes scabiei]